MTGYKAILYYSYFKQSNTFTVNQYTYFTRIDTCHNTDVIVMITIIFIIAIITYL